MLADASFMLPGASSCLLMPLHVCWCLLTFADASFMLAEASSPKTVYACFSKVCAPGSSKCVCLVLPSVRAWLSQACACFSQVFMPPPHMCVHTLSKSICLPVPSKCACLFLPNVYVPASKSLKVVCMCDSERESMNVAGRFVCGKQYWRGCAWFVNNTGFARV